MTPFVKMAKNMTVNAYTFVNVSGFQEENGAYIIRGLYKLDRSACAPETG